MNIWLITIGEPLPINKSSTRLLRVGLLADFLVKNNHSVTWWTSTFDHTQKKHLYTQDTTVVINESYTIILLHAIAYYSNVSIQRIINHYILAQKFKKKAKQHQKPDILLSSLPTLELSFAATEYGNKHNIPVILDIRDLWPDIFLNLAPQRVQNLAKLLLAPFFETVKSACNQATAITGITDSYVEWGVKYAGRSCSNNDRSFPLAYSQITPNPKEITEANMFWHSQGVDKHEKRFIICFFGTFGRQVNLKTVIQSAHKLMELKVPVLFVLCGTGDNFKYYKNLADKCSNILFPGWVNQAQIWTLMRFSYLGIAPYYDSYDFSMSIPNKVIEYWSAGLPIISSLQGTVENLINEYRCGINYHNQDASELTQKIIFLIESSHLAKEMSRNAISLYLDNFVAEKVYANMINYLEAFIFKDNA